MITRVVGLEEAEKCAFAVCCRAGMFSPFDDDETGKCTMCDHDIFFRPTLPQKPMKICVQCASDMIEGTKQ